VFVAIVSSSNLHFMIQLVVNGENEFRKPIPISQTGGKTICMLVTTFGRFRRFSVAACSVIGFGAVRPVSVIGVRLDISQR